MCAFCAKFDIDLSKRDYGELERVSGELYHPRALPHLHKQVNRTTYIQNVSPIYPKYNISKTSGASNNGVPHISTNRSRAGKVVWAFIVFTSLVTHLQNDSNFDKNTLCF